MARSVSDRSESPVRGRGGSPRRKRSPPRRGKSPVRKSSHRDSSPVREKKLSKSRSAERNVSRSPSPRTKRLRRSQAEREVEKGNEREQERNRGRGSDREVDRGTHRGRGSDRDNEKGDRDLERHAHRERDFDRNNNGKSPENERRPDRRGRNRSHSPHQQNTDVRGRDQVTNSKGDELQDGNDDDDVDESVARMKAAEEALAAKEKQKPSFELSGKLAAETNRVKGITLLFTEPPDARKPDVRWRLYVFKNGEALSEPLYIHRQSCYLFGRERRVADIPTDHPSCSKQHAVIQFRQVEKEQPDGTLKKQVRPYVMDLGSTNKTLLNENPIEPERYYELFEKDTIKFGNSSREYVLLHENSA